MKKNDLLPFLLGSCLVLKANTLPPPTSQSTNTSTTTTNTRKVGINVSEPTETLDIDGTLRIRNLNKEANQVYNLVSDENGVVIKGPLSNFIEAGNVYATKKVEINYEGTDGINQNKPYLGVEKTITVPAGRKYAVVIQLSVPVGVVTSSFPHYKIKSYNNPRSVSEYIFPKTYPGYVGIRLVKDGKEMIQASRKVSIPQKTVINVPAAMTTISSSFYDVLDNTKGTSVISVNYKLHGYLETANDTTSNRNETQPQALKRGEGGSIIRFNMWEDDKNADNYNWGHSSLSYQVYWLPTK